MTSTYVKVWSGAKAQRVCHKLSRLSLRGLAGTSDTTGAASVTVCGAALASRWAESACSNRRF